MMRICLLIVSLLITAPLQADSALRSEIRLGFSAPSEFVTVREQIENGKRVVEMVPSGQSAKEWTDMIAYLSHNTDGNVSAAQLFNNALLKHYAEVCDAKVLRNVPQYANYGDYELVIGDLGCPDKKVEMGGDVTRFLILSSSDAVHYLQRTWRSDVYEEGKSPLTKEQDDAGYAFVRSAMICENGEADISKCKPIRSLVWEEAS